jgi:ABC-type amino acid transport substrate-binding protein
MILAARLVLLAAVLFSAGAEARPLRICFAAREFLPVSSPRFEAPGQYLARRAIESRGGQAIFTALPWPRCATGVRTGQFDAALGAVVTDSFLPYMRFPMARQRPDISKSLGDIVFVAIRPVGGSANWDGARFENLTHPVLYNPAARSTFDKLAALGVPRDGGSPQEVRMMTMLLAGRADIAIAREDTAVPLLETPPFRGRIEMLPRPFLDTPSYLAFGKSFHEENAAFDQAVWNEIARLRKEPDWEEKARGLLRKGQAQ